MCVLKQIDSALTEQNKGVFFGYDTDTVKKGAAGRGYLRTVKRGQVANATTDYVRRVQEQNPEFKPGRSWHVRKAGYENLVFHPKTGKAYIAVPFRTDVESTARKEYYIGETEQGPWTPCTYEEGQNILPASKRDDYRAGKEPANGSTVGFKVLKADSIIAIRTGGKTIMLADA